MRRCRKKAFFYLAKEAKSESKIRDNFVQPKLFVLNLFNTHKI